MTLVRGDRLQVYTGKDRTTTVTYQGQGFCRYYTLGCRKPTHWCLTEKGRRMPVDPTPDANGIYTSHWSTCADQERIRARVKEYRR